MGERVREVEAHFGLVMAMMERRFNPRSKARPMAFLVALRCYFAFDRHMPEIVLSIFLFLLPTFLFSPANNPHHKLAIFLDYK